VNRDIALFVLAVCDEFELYLTAGTIQQNPTQLFFEPVNRDRLYFGCPQFFVCFPQAPSL
jgi:hypothetical protein